ncbi:MAG: helix-turn-helix domain-containing protein [Rhodospirillaceae bacterium]|nr:helix-turn-helix domain-containing protein [Rhodospirillaceae bacterium]
MTVVSMSEKEFSRLDVLRDVKAGRLTVDNACELIGVKRRQIFRLLAKFHTDGAAGVVSKRRGRPSNNHLPQAIRDLTMAIVKDRSADFGPALGREKLAEVHDCRISCETLRNWLRAAGL